MTRRAPSRKQLCQQEKLCKFAHSSIRSSACSPPAVRDSNMIIWRRHVPPCTSTDRRDPRCGCPIHYEHRVNGKRIRKTLKTTNWQKALADIRKKELEGTQEKPKSPTIEQACQSYLDDATARDLKDPTLYKFRLLFRQMQDFAKHEGLVYVSDFNVNNTRRFRQSWPNKNFSARKKLESTRAFFRFCQQSGWIQVNPAAVLKPGKTTDPQIIPSQKKSSPRSYVLR
jgi:hypothetical protein